MPIPSRRSSESRIIAVETRTFRSASYTASCERKEHIPVIPAHCHCTVCLSDPDFVKSRNPQRKSPTKSIGILRPAMPERTAFAASIRGFAPHSGCKSVCRKSLLNFLLFWSHIIDKCTKKNIFCYFAT